MQIRLKEEPAETPAELLFEELARTLGEMPEIVLGRRYGCWCIKFRREPFIVLDQQQIAFKVGGGATLLLEHIPPASLWNPRNGRKPKQSWVVHPASNPERIATLSAMAYNWALSVTGTPVSSITEST